MATEVGGATSRAVWFVGPRRAEIRRAPVPEPGPAEVTVEAIASLVSAGTEMKVYRGEIPKGAPVRPSTIEGTFAFPIKYGYQVVGRVTSVGRAVTAYEVGDVVFARHPHQDRFTLPTDQGDPPLVVALPKGTDPELAIFSNLCDVALNATLDVPVRIGDVVVVFGLGVVGMFYAQLAARTAGRLIAVDPLELRRSLARKAGLTTVVAPEDVRAAVREASGGRGADIAVEISGAPAALQEAIRVTGPEGTVEVVSYYGDHPVSLVLTPEFHFGRQRIVSSMTRTVPGELLPRWNMPRRMQNVQRLLPTLFVREMITHRIPLERAADAYLLADEHAAETMGIEITY